MTVILNYADTIRIVNPAVDYTGTGFDLTLDDVSVKATLKSIGKPVAALSALKYTLPTDRNELEHLADHFLIGLVNPDAIKIGLKDYYSAIWSLYGKPEKDIDSFGTLIKRLRANYDSYLGRIGETVVVDTLEDDIIKQLKSDVAPVIPSDLIEKLKTARNIELGRYRSFITDYLVDNKIRKHLPDIAAKYGIDPIEANEYKKITYSDTDTKTKNITTGIYNVYEKNYRRAAAVYPYIIGRLFSTDLTKKMIAQTFVGFYASEEAETLGLME